MVGEVRVEVDWNSFIKTVVGVYNLPIVNKDTTQELRFRYRFNLFVVNFEPFHCHFLFRSKQEPTIGLVYINHVLSTWNKAKKNLFSSPI